MFIRNVLPRLITAFCTGYITTCLIDHYQWKTSKKRLDDVLRQQQEGIDAVKRIFS